MPTEPFQCYPENPGILRRFELGGLSKSELRERLRSLDIQLNPIGEQLFRHPRFVPSRSIYSLSTVELSVAELGLGNGGTLGEIGEQMRKVGLDFCPLETGPFWRLQFLDQAEGAIGQTPTQNCAPAGAITVFSRPLDSSDGTPKGFYLRKIEGMLWLRGYVCGDDHRWSPLDRLLFAVKA